MKNKKIKTKKHKNFRWPLQTLTRKFRYVFPGTLFKNH